MERQLDHRAAALVQARARAARHRGAAGGRRRRLRGRIGGPTGSRGGAEATARVLPADLVVTAIGIRPETALAGDAGLACGRGIQVDDHLTTSDPAIVALGRMRRACAAGPTGWSARSTSRRSRRADLAGRAARYDRIGRRDRAQGHRHLALLGRRYRRPRRHRVDRASAIRGAASTAGWSSANAWPRYRAGRRDPGRRGRRRRLVCRPDRRRDAARHCHRHDLIFGRAYADTSRAA